MSKAGPHDGARLGLEFLSPDRNPIVRLMRRLMPVTPDLHGQRFVVTLEGRRHATPLLVALVAGAVVASIFSDRK